MFKRLMIGVGVFAVASFSATTQPEPIQASTQYIEFIDIPYLPICFFPCQAFFPSEENCCVGGVE